MMAKGIVIPKINAKLGPLSDYWTSPPLAVTWADVTSIPATEFPDDKRFKTLLYSLVASLLLEEEVVVRFPVLLTEPVFKVTIVTTLMF